MMNLQVVNPVRRSGVSDLLEALGSIESSENDGQDNFDGRLPRVLARYSDIGEASLAPESSLALGDSHLERAKAVNDGAYLGERLQRSRVTCEELRRGCAFAQCHGLILAPISDVRTSEQEEGDTCEDRDDKDRLHCRPPPGDNVIAQKDVVARQALHQDQQR